MQKKLICVSGLPRSGSTLLCQLLNQHPDIYSIGHSSPLLGTIDSIRHKISDNDFLLSQLDVDFECTYNRLRNAYRGFINGWFEETDLSIVVDKNRGWLRAVEMLHELVPNYYVLVCIRNLAQIFGSIEKQHAKTRLLDFPDHIDAHGSYARADRLFGRNGIVGGPIRFIEDMQDITNQEIHDRIYYTPFEELIKNPIGSMSTLFEWLSVEPYDIDIDKLTTSNHESDSYYRFKYRHATLDHISPPSKHVIPPRIEHDLINKYNWYYKRFYPDYLTAWREKSV